MEASGVQTSGLSFVLKQKPGEYVVTPDDPELDPGVDDGTLNPKVVAAIEVFRKALVELAETSGVTYEDFKTAGMQLAQTASEEPGMTYLFFDVLMKPAFFPDADTGFVTPEQMEGPVYFPGAPEISNPGVLPMRPDEEGTQLIASGQVRSADGTPLVGAELDIWLAAANGHYSLTGLDDQPDWNLRARQFTDEQGRYEFRTIKPVPYYIPVMPEGLEQMMAALGYNKFRPRHIHVKIRHPELAEEFTTQLYFKGDPYLKYDLVTKATGPQTDALVLELEEHGDPSEIAERGLDRPFETLEYDFVLDTKSLSSPVA
jgi:catechol 1,2-dioxygenase